MLPEEYGCAVANRFGHLLDDDVDPFDLLKEAETEKDKKKKKRQEDDKKSKQKKPGQRETQRDRRVPVDASQPVPVRKLQSQASPQPERAEEDVHRATKRAAHGGKKMHLDDAPQEFSVPRPLYEDGDTRLRGGFRGARRGGGRGVVVRNTDNVNLRGKREYDRHNGTGISPEEKRGGRGPWNWGSVDDAACELMEMTDSAKVTPEESQAVAADEGNQVMQEDEGEMVVSVAVEMSLDEWKALQEMNRPKVEFNIRKAENKIPSKAKVIHESKHLESLKKALEDLDEEGTFLRRSVNDITSLMDINFGSLGRPTRGGRGRGGGQRGGTKSSGSAQPERMTPAPGYTLAPDPYDPEDFPALSSEP